MPATPSRGAFPHLFEPLELGRTVLRSRIYVPAHQPLLAEDGVPGERYIAYQRARARGGAAMQITGATPVLQSSLWGPEAMLLNLDERIVPGYRRLADAVHLEGGKMLAQLAHAGAMVSSADTGLPVLSASRVVSELTREVAKPLDRAEIEGVVQAFAAAAGRAIAGGLDGVELLMAYGLLLGSFLSPRTNQREDEWGGTLEGRLRLPLAVLDAVRERIGPEPIVGVRLAGDELVDGGIEIAEAVEIGRRLAATGVVDYLSVIAGQNLERHARVRHWPPTPAPHGLFRHLAAAMKQAVPGIPVCSVGRITSPAMAEEILARGEADLVGMVRAHIADPELLRKARAGRVAEIRPCVGANVCINHALDGRAIRCIANPDLGRPEDGEEVARDATGTAVVVGAGPGGLEAARVLALRGLHVVLFEREGAVGGQMARWAVGSMGEVRRLVEWWESSIRAAGVDLRLGTEAGVETIGALEPDRVVVATGSVPDEARLPAESSPIAQPSVWEALAGLEAETVVVADELGRGDAALVAERLAGTCGTVILVTSCVHVGEGEGITTLYPLLTRLNDLDVRLVERARPVALSGRTVRLEGTFGRDPDALEDVDVLVYWRGGVSLDALAEPLRAQGLAVQVVGDALAPRRAHDAVFEAARAGRAAVSSRRSRSG